MIAFIFMQGCFCNSINMKKLCCQYSLWKYWSNNFWYKKYKPAFYNSNAK